MSAVDNDLLDTLTPEERAAIAEVDAEEIAALERVAAGAGADPGGDDERDDDTAAGDDAGADAGAQPAAGADNAKGTDTPAAAEPTAKAAAPVYRAELPADFDEQKAGLDSKLTELREKFRGGEIELDDYEAQRAELDQQRDKLRAQELKAEISQEMNAQTAEQLWKQAISNQLAAALKPENGGIDYKADAEKFQDLDAFVRQLGSRTENADKPMDWFLAEAHRRVLALHGVKTAAPAPKADPVREAIDKRRPPADAVPPTVAHVPGADGKGDMGDEFADLDRLEGVELEAALARLTPAQREKYAAGV